MKNSRIQIQMQISVAADDSAEVTSPPADLARPNKCQPIRKSPQAVQHSTGGIFELLKSNENSHNVSSSFFIFLTNIQGEDATGQKQDVYLADSNNNTHKGVEEYRAWANGVPKFVCDDSSLSSEDPNENVSKGQILRNNSESVDD